MLDFMYQNGWGAFTTLLFIEIPFVTIFLYVVFRKSFTGTEPVPSNMGHRSLARLEGVWVLLVIGVFVVLNVASIKYMPTVQAAEADEKSLEQVKVTASSWAFDISDREFEVGQSVRFSIKSSDTVHGFAVYHPDGRLIFTTMLIPGLDKATSIVYTFTEPGKYKVRCLEYCGIAHHTMQDELIVTASTASAS